LLSQSVWATDVQGSLRMQRIEHGGHVATLSVTL
jgi:hypothetical protein